ncbi:MAG TPA: SDR family oxidoreductase [Thermomicrobiales bacterium]|nr:SDR family oxidoreductase [Thermomicrobiales bacterium]
MNDLSGRTAIVTGASRGIGVYIAEELCRQGMRLALAARGQPELEAIAAGLRQDGREIVVIPTDLASAASRASLVEEALRTFGHVDVLVNNAAMEVTLPFHRISETEIDQTIQVSLTAPISLMRLLVPHMLERRSGHIVNIGSLAGKSGPPFSGTYGATKAGLIAFTETFRSEYHGSGVSASVICPGYVRESGMYHRIAGETGIRAPWFIGTSRPEAIARAVTRAISRDVPEIIVNPVPMRFMTAVSELSPGLGEWLTRRSGANTLWEQAARSYERERSE